MAGHAVYSGTYTGRGSEGIYRFEIEDGRKAGAPALAAKIANPTFVELSPCGRFLYAVSEEREGSISAFSVEPDGGLKPMQSLPTLGAHPCHIALSPDMKFIVVANYSGGNVMIRGVSPDGTLSADPVMLHHDGRGPNSKRQEKAHPHGATFNPDGEFLYVPDLGIDRVVAYRYSGEYGSFEKMDGAGFRSRPGAGPRHLTFGANGRFAYLINELDNTVVSMRSPDGTGKLEEISTLSCLPANFAGENTAAEIQVAPDGRNLYVSNRGHDSIAVFKLFPDGTMSLAGHKTGGIRKPRHFGVSPDGRTCLVSNEDGGDIAAFELDLVSGMLCNQLFSVRIDKPVCAKFSVPRA